MASHSPASRNGSSLRCSDFLEVPDGAAQQALDKPRLWLPAMSKRHDSARHVSPLPPLQPMPRNQPIGNSRSNSHRMTDNRTNGRIVNEDDDELLNAQVPWMRATTDDPGLYSRMRINDGKGCEDTQNGMEGLPQQSVSNSCSTPSCRMQGLNVENINGTEESSELSLQQPELWMKATADNPTFSMDMHSNSAQDKEHREESMESQQGIWKRAITDSTTPSIEMCHTSDKGGIDSEVSADASLSQPIVWQQDANTGGRTLSSKSTAATLDSSPSRCRLDWMPSAWNRPLSGPATSKSSKTTRSPRHLRAVAMY